ncbi:conserved hypothetical protein [Gammaproteobacteria bacterium]
MDRPQRRRIVFIQPVFQGHFIGWMIGLMALSGVVSAIVFALLLTIWSGRTLATPPLEGWLGLGLLLVIGNVVAILVTGIAVTFVVVYLSHRIAGPMYRLARLCEEVGKGNYDISTSLRRHDELQDLAMAFSEMLRRLRNRRDTQQSAIHKAQQTISNLRTADTADYVNLLDNLDQQLRTLGGTPIRLEEG